LDFDRGKRTMMIRSFLFIFSTVLLPLSVHCFVVISQHTPLCSQSSVSTNEATAPFAAVKALDQQRQYRTCLHSSNDEEIAALEEKLRKLKEGGSTEQDTTEAEVSPSEKIPGIATELFEEKRFKISKDSTNVMVTGEPAEPFEELLSEQWKTREGDGIDLKDILVKGASAVAILAGIVAFSQIPIGQEDLDRYSTAKPSTAIDLGDLNVVGEGEQASYLD